MKLERNVYCRSPRLALLRNQMTRCSKYVSARYNLTQFFDQVELEKRDKITGLQPDVMLCNSAGTRRCYIEIFVTHACSKDKIDTGIPIIEFNIQSVDDIELIYSGIYSIKDERLNVFNWRPPSRIDEQCNGTCSVGSIDMSVWYLTDLGRLNEKIIPLSDVDLTVNSEINTWPKNLRNIEIADNLRNFLRHADPQMEFSNCIMCVHANSWENGYLQCQSKAKLVPYTEANQCAIYKVKM